MGRWIVNSVSQGVASSEAELVRSPEGSTLPSSEAEVRFAVEGLGEGASSETEIVSRVRGGGLRMGRTAELGCELGLFPFGSEENCGP